MNLKLEKRPADIKQETYFVLSIGDKNYEMESNSVKAVLLMWVFFAVVFFTYVVGVYSAQQNVMMTAYLLKGNITTDKGEPVSCQPIMTSDKKLEWDCIVNRTAV